MTFGMEKKLIRGFLVLFSLCIFDVCENANEKESFVKIELDMSDHPVYSGYDFSKNSKVIEIGTQPLWIPTSLISEAMKRDSVLNDVLLKQGFEIKFFPFYTSADLNFFINKGDLEAGIGGDLQTLTAIVVSDVVVSTLIMQGFCAFVAKKYFTIDEFRGKRLGIALGSNAHFALLRNLNNFGLSESDVDVIPLDVNEMPEALDKNIIDIFSACEPIPTIATNKYKDQLKIHRSLHRGYLYFTNLFSKKYPDVVRHIVAAEIRAIQWMQQNRSNLLTAGEWSLNAGEILSGNSLDLSVEQIANLAQKDIIGLSSNPMIPDNYLKNDGPLIKQLEFLINAGKIPDSISWEKVVDNFDRTVVNEVIINPEKYSLNTFNYRADKSNAK